MADIRSAAAAALGVDSAAAVVSAVVVDRVAVAADSRSQPIERVDLLGAPLDLADRIEIEQRIAMQLAGSDPGLLHVVTLNPEYVIGCRKSELFRMAVERAELSIPDGAGVVAAARFLLRRQFNRTTGVDLVEWILTADQLREARVFLLGSPASVAELHGRFPSRIVGRWGDGTPDVGDDAASIDRIRDRQATLVLVGYGAPGQVLWIERNRADLADAGVRVAIGVGGALDYLAGTVPRAPMIARRLGLEWLYRLVREPWRWRRQLALPEFAMLMARERIRQFRKS